MNLGKYIQTLLLEHETVIVPGLGAFISKYKPAEPDEESGEMLPPSKEILFDPKIQNNDGLLTGQVAEQEEVSNYEALKRIKETCEDIIFRLDKGERVTLEGAGVLFYDESREIRFESSGEENLLLDAFGLEATSLTGEPENIQEKKAENGLETEAEEKEGTVPDELGAESVPEEETEPSPVYEPFFNEPYEPYKKKKRGWLWFLILLIPLIAAGIYFFMLKEEAEEQQPEVDITVEPAPAEAQKPEERNPEGQNHEGSGASALATDGLDTSGQGTANTVAAADDSVSVQSYDQVNIPKAGIDSSLMIKPDMSKFYLVGGSFKEPGNAEKYLQFLNREGYKPFHLGKHGSFYIVGIETFEKEREAFSAQIEFLEKYPESGVWIFNLD
ncbi:HU domain-containing protein [Mariniphaga sediminis]|nr:hypothetical protein [Mariniphaga sediminis]